MIPLPSKPKKIKKDKNKSVFEIDSLYPGYGITIGNSLRRVLLSSLSGAAITEIKIKGADHQFSTLSGVYEDTIMIIQSLKKLRFKVFEGEEQTIKMKVKGKKEVKGEDFKLPTQVEIANPDCHIVTLTGKSSQFEMEAKIEKGVGYEPVSRRKNEKKEIGIIPIDAIFSPVKKVNFEVENMRVGERTDFDKLTLEIETDGTVTPQESFREASQILADHYNLFLGEEKGESKKEVSEGESEDVKKEKIEEQDFSKRTMKALTENSIKTIGGLLQKKEEDLLEIDGFGDKGLKEVKKILKKHNLELKNEEA